MHMVYNIHNIYIYCGHVWMHKECDKYSMLETSTSQQDISEMLYTPAVGWKEYLKIPSTMGSD